MIDQIVLTPEEAQEILRCFSSSLASYHSDYDGVAYAADDLERCDRAIELLERKVNAQLASYE